jgi:hypothetical protein
VIDLNKKGQGALEYLMTYGWALLVIVVVGAALFALGVLNPSTYTQKSCRGFNFFQYQDQQMSTTAFRLQLLNGANPVAITNMAVINGGNGDLGALTITDDTSNPLTGTVSQGQKITIAGASDPTNSTAGQPYTYTIRVTYDVVGGISGNTDQATCSGRIQ